MMKTKFALVAGVMLVAGCASMDDDSDMGAAPMAGQPPMAQPAGVGRMDHEFAMMSASGNMFEVESSRLALQASQNPMIRQFAQQMINDHGAMLSRMAQLAARHGVDTSGVQMAPHHRQMLDRLRAAGSGPAFDAAYHQAQLMAHQESLALHQTYAQNGTQPDLRALAAQAVPVIQNHLNMLQMHGQHMMQPQVTPTPGERG